MDIAEKKIMARQLCAMHERDLFNVAGELTRSQVRFLIRGIKRKQTLPAEYKPEWDLDLAKNLSRYFKYINFNHYFEGSSQRNAYVKQAVLEMYARYKSLRFYSWGF